MNWYSTHEYFICKSLTSTKGCQCLSLLNFENDNLTCCSNIAVDLLEGLDLEVSAAEEAVWHAASAFWVVRFCNCDLKVSTSEFFWVRSDSIDFNLVSDNWRDFSTSANDVLASTASKLKWEIALWIQISCQVASTVFFFLQVILINYSKSKSIT